MTNNHDAQQSCLQRYRVGDLLALLVALLLCVGLVAQPAMATVYRVTTSGTDAASGADWATNAITLQGALATAMSGDEIWVAAGIYKPGAVQSSTFNIGPDLAVYGGFAGTETALSQRNWTTNVTVLEVAPENRTPA
jgi:hypothetical protein